MGNTSESRALQHRLCGFGCFLLFIGVAGFGGLEVAKRRIRHAATFPSVEGKIVNSAVVTSAVKNGRVLIVSPHANTDYSYSVKGKTYRGEMRRVLPMLHFDTEGTPEEVVAKYPVGKKVRVYYDPSNPADSLLTPIPETSAQSLIQTLGLVAPVVAGIGLLIAGMAGFRLWRERQIQPKVNPETESFAAALLNPTRTERPIVVALAAPPKPPRTTHWLIRGVATILGLAMFLFGALVTIVVPRINDPRFNGTAMMVIMGIFGGVTLFGAFLIWVGMRQPRMNVQTA